MLLKRIIIKQVTCMCAAVLLFGCSAVDSAATASVTRGVNPEVQETTPEPTEVTEHKEEATPTPTAETPEITETAETKEEVTSPEESEEPEASEETEKPEETEEAAEEVAESAEAEEAVENTQEPIPEETPDPTPEPTPEPTPDPTPEPTPEPIIINYDLYVNNSQTDFDCKPGSYLNTLDMIGITDGENSWLKNTWGQTGAKVTASEENLNLGVPGSQTITYTLTYTDGEGKEVTKNLKRTYKFKDKKAPTIMCSAATVYLYKGDVFSPEKTNILYVRDEVDGNIPYKSGNNSNNPSWYTVTHNVNTNSTGTYKVDIKAADKSGNISTETYNVVVSEKPIPAPVQQYTPSNNNWAAAAVPAGTTYVANTRSKKFHNTWCSSVNDMSAANRWDYTGSRDDLINWGYQPCKRCNP